MELLNTKNAPQAIGPYSQAVKVNDLIYTSGQIALTPEGKMCENNIKIQTKQIFSNLKAILEDNNSDLSQVIKINIFLININDFEIVNSLMIEEFGNHKPARSTIEVKGLPKNAMIEMDLIATITNCQ